MSSDLYAKLAESKSKKTEAVVEVSTPTSAKPKVSRSNGTNIPSYQPTNIPNDVDGEIAVIHKALRDKTNAAASYRFSTMEKQRLEVTLFELKMRSMSSPDEDDIRSNENEVMRIALNHVLNDYKANGDESILVKALKSLRS